MGNQALQLGLMPQVTRSVKSERVAAEPGVAVSAFAPDAMATQTMERPSVSQPLFAGIHHPARPLPSMQFQGAIHNDYSVEIRGDVPVNAGTASQLLQSMLLRDIAKGDEKSSLKFYLGAFASDKYRHQDQAALADTMAFISRPVDVVIKAAATPDVLKTLLSATGKRFIYPGASLYVGKMDNAAAYGKNKDAQVRRKLFNDYHRDLKTLIMQRTGKKDAAEVHQDTMSDKNYNALQSLNYGKKGLVDGILIGYDKVITRKDLDAFYASKGWDPVKNAKQIDAFNQDYMNLYQVSKANTTPLKTFSKSSLPSKEAMAKPEYSNYESLSESAGDDKDVAPEMMQGDPSQGETLMLDANDMIEKDNEIYVRIKQPKVPDPIPTFYFETPKGMMRTQQLALNSKAAPFQKFVQVEVANLPVKTGGILEDDVIYFNDAFTSETAEQIAEALLALDDKKSKQKNPSNIKILENSPGGSVWSGQELRGTIASMRTPVDVIVTGMGASCGSWLLCSATGNRFATPNARIMIHEAATSSEMSSGDSFNHSMDSLNQATRDYVAIVADAVDRPFKDVWEDFKLDSWYNPVESLFYGKKGFIDGILVGHDKVITRKDVEKYLIKTLGSRAKMNEYVEKKLLQKREPDLTWEPKDLRNDDPFDNPLDLIQKLSKEATSLSKDERFQHSAPSNEGGNERKINYFNVISTDDEE